MSEADVTEFICEDCRRDITSLGGHDGIPVCGVCRFIRSWPECPEEVKAKLRGDIMIFGNDIIINQ